jgi:hypothetical protein
METLGVVVRVLLILRAVFYRAGIALLWFLIAALLRFLGRIGPGLGCRVLGILASVRALALNSTRH